MSEYLELKWGTLKGYSIETEPFRDAMQALFDEAPRSASTMLQKDTDRQKELLCAVIDACSGDIWNDWSGEQMTKDEAKTYVRDY